MHLNFDMTSKKRPVRSSQTTGLARIEEIFYRAGARPAMQLMQRLLDEDHSSRDYFLSDAGVPSLGVDIAATDDIAYESFSPPSSWNVNYSIQRVKIGPSPKNHYVSYIGEEIFFPVQGEVSRHFFFSAGLQQPYRMVHKISAASHAAIRINPQIPHHMWSTSGMATGWLALRHESSSPAALMMQQDNAVPNVEGASASEKSAQKEILGRRVLTEAQLSKPGAYALIAWGIADSIRNARQKTRLTGTQLAALIGIDPSSLSRLEDAKANVSTEMLAKVCHILRMGVGERIESGSWLCDISNPESSGGANGVSMLSASVTPHELHPYQYRLGRGTTQSLWSGRKGDQKHLSSWILVKGRALITLPGDMGGKSFLMDADNVLHLRRACEIQVNALENSLFVQVVQSNDCHCAVRGKDAGSAGVRALSLGMSANSGPGGTGKAN